VTAKTYRLAAWAKPVPQPAHRELRLAFPKGQRQPLAGQVCATCPWAASTER